MPFTIFQNSTTAYANEVMDNFYFIANGDRFPRGGSGLETTDSVFDLGSSTYKWNKLYCNHLSIANEITTTVFIKELVNTSDSGTSRIEISGLNGDNTNFLISLFFVGITASSYLGMSINGESTTSNHRTKENDNFSNGVRQTLDTNSTYIQVCRNFATNSSNYFKGFLFSKTGQNRILKGFGTSEASGNVISSVIDGYYSSTSDTITSLVFESNFNLSEYNIVIWSD